MPKTTKPFDVPSLPVPNGPFSTSFAISKPAEPKTVHDYVYQTVWGNHVIALHWVYRKKWNDKHKPKLPRKVWNAFEPHGDFLLSILNLCEALHTIGHPIAMNYKNAGRWFDLICREVNGPCSDSNSKKDVIARLRKFLNDCKGIEDDSSVDAGQVTYYWNPGDSRSEILYPPLSRNGADRDIEPHFWNLVEAATSIEFGELAPKQQRELWFGHGDSKDKGFIPALRGMIRMIESPAFARITTETAGKAQLYMSGRQRLTVFRESEI